MYPRTRRRPLLSSATLVGVLSALISASCSGEDTSVDSAVEELDPAELKILSVTNTMGEAFSKDEAAVELPVVCDARLTVSLGPVDQGVLANWFLRPPGNCSSIEPCGFVRVSAIAEDGAVLAQSQQASINVVLALSGVALEDVKAIRAELIQGQTLDRYRTDAGLVFDSWDVNPVQLSCPEPGIGGAGGAPGTGGGQGTGGSTSLGGAGGFGGHAAP